MKARSITLASAAVAVGIAALAAGCGTSSSTGNSTASATPQQGGVLTVALPSQTNLDWYLPINTAASDQVYNSWLQDQIYKPLIHLNDKYQIVWKSSIASNITYNKAGTVYHVFIGKNWKWSNGHPVTAGDLMFTWNVVKTAALTNQTPWPYVGNGTGDIPAGIKSVVENNSHEVTFTLDKPANQQWFIYNGLIQLTPMPAQALDHYGSDWSREVQYLGTIASSASTGELASDGPFELKSATPSQNWTLVPNPDYGGHKSLVNKLVFEYEGSSTSEFASLANGSLDLGYLDPTQLGSSAKLTSMGDKIFPGYSLGDFWTEMNMYPGTQAASIFDHLYVRQALMESQDQKSIIKDVWHGYAVPDYGPIPSTPSTKFYSAQAEPAVSYNLKAAKSLLESHGWHEVNGVMTKGSQHMNFTMIYVSGVPATQDTAEIMQADWKQIGVKVNLVPKNFNEYLTMTSDSTSNAWQLALGSGWDYNGPGWYPSGGQLFATKAPSGTGYSSLKEDQLIADTHQPYATTAQSMKVFDNYEAYTASQLPMLWGPNSASIDVAGSALHGGRQYINAVTNDPQFNYMWVAK